MYYFVISTVMVIIICVLLFLWLLSSLRMNWSNRNTMGISFLLPAVLSIVLLIFSFYELRPRISDIFSILQDNTEVILAEPGTLHQRGKMLIFETEKFRVGPEMIDLSPDMAYRVKIAPKCRIVLNVEAQDDFSADPMEKTAK